jgi:glycine/D-amino acid oxidase-like deaminating enzyme
MVKSFDIAVVGAGSTSLSEAAYMAKASKNAHVLEKNRHRGDGAISVEVAPGEMVSLSKHERSQDQRFRRLRAKTPDTGPHGPCILATRKDLRAYG